jgi:hypothetical protein
VECEVETVSRFFAPDQQFEMHRFDGMSWNGVDDAEVMRRGMYVKNYMGTGGSMSI